MDDLSKLLAAGQSGGMNRRQFLTRASALGIGLSSASSLWSIPAHASDEQPIKGGHLRLGLAGASTTDTWDSALWSDSFMVLLGYAVRGGLLEVAPDGSLRPDAASSWEAQNGAKKWVFKIQRGATFSNGKSLTAEDIVVSLNYHRDDKSRSAAKAVFEQVTDIRADGKDTVIISLSAPDVGFAYALTDQHLNIYPAVDGEADWRSGIGIGPYKVDSFQPGVRAVLSRNMNSHRVGHIDSAELIAIEDVVARQAALQSGQVDGINRVSLKTAHLLGKTKGLRLQETVGRLNYWLTANTTAEGFNNRDLRLALKYGLDRQQLLQVIFNGHGQVGNDQPITPGYRYYDASNVAKTYDPEKAKFHLKKTGRDTLSVKLHTSEAAFPGAVDFATLYKQQAAKAGINIDVIREGSDGYWAKVKSNTPSWYMTYWSGRVTEDGMLSTVFAESSQRNYTKWKNPEFNQLLVSARGELDETKRRQMYGRMQQIVSDDGGAIIPIFGNYVDAYAQRVRAPKVIATNENLDGSRLLERWWIDPSKASRA